MEKKYIIQSAISKEYWAGRYGNAMPTWNQDIGYAETFENKEQIEELIRSVSEFDGMPIFILELWRVSF